MSGLQPSGALATASSRSAGPWLTALRTQLVARTGFWRALLEVLVGGHLCVVLLYALAPIVGSPWGELLSYLTFCVYPLAAWRLRPGAGLLPLRVLRVLLWGLLLGVVVGLVGWAVWLVAPYPGTFMGIRAETVHVSPQIMILNALTTATSLFYSSRLLLALWEAGRSYLRWRFTFATLLVGIVTMLLVPVAMMFYVAILSLSVVPPMTFPDVAGMRVAPAVAPLLGQASTEELRGTLQGVLDGTVVLPLPAGMPFDEGPISSFDGVRRLSVLQPDGVVLASVGPEPYAGGGQLPEAQRERLRLLWPRVPPGGCVNGHPSTGPMADTAICALGGSGAPAGYLLVETYTDGSMQFGLSAMRIVQVVVITAIAVTNFLLIGVVGILLVSGGLGYLLSRRMTRRLELLAQATADVAAGNLDRRLAEDGRDEIGRLSTDFNLMARRLQEREEALTAEKERAERLLAANRRLVANVSHELRTPLATVRGYMEALEQEHGAQLPAHDLAVIQNEIGRLTKLIEELFTLARAEAQQLPLALEPVDVLPLVRRLAETVAPLARRDCQVEVVAALPSQLPQVSADRARLEQVLLNLLQNALRHTLPGGIIAVEGAAGPGGVTVTVADTGSGIPAEEQHLIFERFYRSDSARAREQGGAGLGLALVKELVSAMGGSVAVESIVGQGSRFSITLPLAGG